MAVIPSDLTSDERNDLQDLHGLCWNTDDMFDDDVPEYHEIMEFHRQIDTAHWYLPFHDTLCHEQYATEIEAYQAARRANLSIH